jgi:Flp pilus assembly protein TadG
MMKRLFRLARDQKGAAAIELALVAPVLAVMVAGVADISIAYSRRLEIEQAAQRAIEKVMQTTGETTPADEIKREACIQINGATTTTTTSGGVTTTTTSCAPGRIDISDIDAEYTLKCNGVEKAYTLDCAAGETEVRYIETTVHDYYEPMFPLHWGTGADGKYHLRATAGVRVA